MYIIISFIVPENQYIIPGIVANKGTDIIISDCEIKGNTKEMLTIGILSIKANLFIIKDSKIHSH